MLTSDTNLIHLYYLQLVLHEYYDFQKKLQCRYQMNHYFDNN